jgi:hypothetical protein
MYALPPSIHSTLRRGVAIPAHPLALTENRKLDERRQRALSRYYLAAGVGGLAVGVHTTQFEIRKPEVGLFRPVLELAIEEIVRADEKRSEPAIRVAGVIGRTAQAVAEAKLVRDLGYHVALLGLAALKDADDEALVEHCRAVAEIIPVMGFYLQPAVGGRILSERFWTKFAQIENVVAIKVAPFNRYHTLDVVRGVAASGRASEIAMYTGNDDSIVTDLITPYDVLSSEGDTVTVRFAGGLLGHWAVWTHGAVQLLDDMHALTEQSNGQIPESVLTLATQVTDMNAAVFDAKNDYAGVIAGVHEVLRRQGILEGTWCLDESETLSSGQAEELSRVSAAYPHLTDDAFVEAHLHEWLA